MRKTGAPFRLGLLAGTFLVTNQDVPLADASPAVQVSTFGELAAAIEQTQPDQINLTGAGFDLERTLQVTAGKSISVTGTNAVLRCTDACFKVSGTSSVLQLSDIELQLGTGFQSTTHDVSATSFFTVETGGAVETTDVTFSPGVCAGWHFMQGKCISDASTEAVTWNEADTACRAVGANLVSIHTNDENLVILSRVREGGHSSTWLGASFDPQDQLQWSDQSSSTGYKWPLVSSSSGDCVIMDTTYGGMWARVPCSSTVDLHHYRCAIQVAAAPSIKQVIGDGVGFQHSNPTLFVENPTELVQAHGNTDIISTITTIRYRDVNDNVFNVPVTGTTPYTVQVRVTGTGLTNDMQVTLDTASAAATTASTDGTIATFDLSVSGLPQNLHLKAGTTLASASKVEVVLQSQVVLSHQLDQEVACTTMAPLGTFNPFNANANNEITIDANQALSLAMTQSGCSVFTLWTPTGQVSPFQLELEGTDLNQLQVSDGSEIIDVPVSSDGIVELRYNDVGFVQPTFTISRSSASSSCIKNVAFKYHGEVIGSMSAKSLFDNCAEVCGAVYQQVDECLMFDSTDFLLENLSLELLTTSVCDQVTQGIVSNQESLESICTYDGPFTPEILDEVFGASDFSTFKFNSSLPESLELPSNALLAKNRELILDGDNQIANETLPLVVPWFEIEGSATLDYVHLINGIKVSNGGFLSASLTTLSGVAELTVGGSTRWNGGTVNLENVPSFTVGSDSTLYLAGTKIPTPSGVTQSSHIAQVTGSGKVSVTNLYLDNVAVEIANDMSKVEFASAQRSYAYTQCSNDPTAVPFSDLTFVATTNSFEECKSTCENAAQCSGIGLSTDESTGEIRCSQCLAQSCLIACDGPSGYYFEAKSGGGYVSLNGCFATVLNNADPIKSTSLSVSKRDTAVLECQARCEVYSKCASVRVSNTQSPFTCDLYEVDEVNTECGSPQEYHVKFAASGVDYVPVPYADLKVEPVAARSVGTYTSDECVEYCTIHEACNMVEYSGTTCTLLSHDDTLPAPWSSPSYTPDTEILVPTGDGFPRVFYEVVEQAFKLITDNSDFLEWNGRVAKVQACERKCSAFGYCVAFAFAEPSSLDDDDDNCFLYNAVGARNALAEESTTNSFDLHLAVSSIKFDNVYVPFGTNCSEVEDYVDEVAGVHFENIDAIDSCGSICFMRSTCDMFEYSYQNATCTIYPNTNLTSSFACDHQNAIYDNNMHKFETASPLVTSVRYAKAESGCLEYTLTTTQPASSTSSLEACKVMCDLHPECTAFFYSNGCELIHTLLAKQEDLCVTPNVREFYLSSHNPERDAYTQIPFDACFVVDRNHEGATIINADDVSACRKACFEDYNCRAYSFDAARSEGGKCVLHDDATMEPGVDCNAEQAFVETFEKYFVAASSAENVTVVGSEELLTTPNPVSLKECQALCDVFEACVAIAIDSSLSDGSFLDGESDCVLLKASADGAVGTATYSRIDNTDLAVMNAYDPYLFTEVVERNVYPDPSKEIILSTNLVVPRQSDCEALCEVVAGCYSLMYDVSASNYGQCKLYEQGSLTEEEYAEATPRQSTLRYMISYAKFVNPKPSFVSFNDNGSLFPSNLPYQVKSNVTSGTACERICLESKEQCEFARYRSDTSVCEMYPEGTKMDNNGLMPNLCQRVTLSSFGTFQLAELTVLDAAGKSLYDSSSSPWNLGNLAVDGETTTTVSAFDLPICTQRPIGEMKFKFVEGSGLISVRATKPYTSGSSSEQDTMLIGDLVGTETNVQSVQVDLNTWISTIPGYSRRDGLCSLDSRTLATLRPLLPNDCAEHCTKMKSCVAFSYKENTAMCSFFNTNPSSSDPSCEDIPTYMANSFHRESPVSFSTDTSCDGYQTHVQIEVDGSSQTFLSLCAIELRDRYNRSMIDPSAPSNTEAYPTSSTAIPGVVVTGRADRKVCFKSEPIAVRQVGYLESTLCTPNPVASVHIVTDSDFRGTRLTVVNHQEIKFQFEQFNRENGELATEWSVRLMDVPSKGCVRLQLESKTTNDFKYGEVRLYGQSGNRLVDTNAAKSAESNFLLNSDVSPRNLLDGDDYTIFVGKYWNAQFCSPEVVAQIVLVAAPGQVADDNMVDVTVFDEHGVSIVSEIAVNSANSKLVTTRFATHETRLPEINQYCTTIQIELGGENGKALNICEVMVQDANGVAMYDPFATTSGSHDGSGKAIGSDSQDECYRAEALRGEVAWIRVEFCTQRPAATVRVKSKDGSGRHAIVSVIIGGKVHRVGSLNGDPIQDTWVFAVPTFHSQTYCDTVRVELVGDTSLHDSEGGNYLQLCEVQVYDENGVAMFDPYAGSRASSSGVFNALTADKAVDGELEHPGCFTSNQIPNGDIGWWQTTFCTPRPISDVRVTTTTHTNFKYTSRINGAIIKRLGQFETEHTSLPLTYGAKTKSSFEVPRNQNIEDDLHCGILRVELDGTSATSDQDKKYLQLCEVELIDSAGQVMFDTYAASHVQASPTYREHLSAETVVDGNDNTKLGVFPWCYHSDYIAQGETGFWETKMCTPRPAAKVLVTTRGGDESNDYYKNRINGARVSWDDGVPVDIGVIESTAQQVSFEFDLHATCATIRVELVGDTSLHDSEGGNYLQLCEVQVYDENGVAMFDPNAASRASSSGVFNALTADKAVDGELEHPGCFTSNQIPNGDIGWWQTTFCTPRPISDVRVTTTTHTNFKYTSRINGAKVLLHGRPVGILQQNFVNQFTWDISIPSVCETVRVELVGDSSRHNLPGNYLYLCDVEVFDAEGTKMFDPYATSGAKASGVYYDKSPDRAIDTESSSCFISSRIENGDIGWWEAKICTPRPIATIQVTTTDDENYNYASRANGAKVYLTSSSNIPMFVGELESMGWQKEWNEPVEIESTQMECTSIRFELFGDSNRHSSPGGNYLQLCEVELLDETGSVLFDTRAGSRASASGAYTPSNAAERAVDSSEESCFISNQIANGEIGWWQTTICTLVPIAQVRVKTTTTENYRYTSRINGAEMVLHKQGNGEPILFPPIYQQSTNQWVWSFSIDQAVAAVDDAHCENIRIELLGDNSRHSSVHNALQLCEVEVLDEDGIVMFDESAASRVTSSAYYSFDRQANRAVDGALDTNGLCFISELISHGDTGWWETTFCTPRPVASVRVTTSSHSNSEWTDRINGAVVYRRSDQGVLNTLHVLHRDFDDQLVWDIPFSQEHNQFMRYESQVVVSLDGNDASNDADKKYLQICEVQVFDSKGSLMFDSTARERVQTSHGVYGSHVASRAVDGDISSAMQSLSCFHGGYIGFGQTGSWKTTFLTPRPVNSIRVITRNDADGFYTERINGARVTLTDHQGVEYKWPTLQSVDGSYSWDVTIHGSENQVLPLQYCEYIRVELTGDTKWHTSEGGNYLQLCEVQVYDENGVAMFDPNAGSLARSSGVYQTLTADKAVDGELEHPGCFTSNQIPNGDIGWWQTTFCTPRPISDVRVTTTTHTNFKYTSRINGVMVYRGIGAYAKLLGQLRMGSNPEIAVWDLHVNPAGHICETVKVELIGDTSLHDSEGGNYLQLCEVQVYDENGVAMFDPYAGSRASSSGVFNALTADKAVDGELEHPGCFTSNQIPNGDIGWWQTTFCTPRLIADVRVTTTTHTNFKYTSRINGATVHVKSPTAASSTRIGRIQYSENQFQWTLARIPQPGCEEVRIELDVSGTNSKFSLCEIEVFDTNGQKMKDPRAGLNTLADVQGWETRDSQLAIDDDVSTCFETPTLEAGSVALWQSTVCVPRSIGSIVVQTSSLDMSKARVIRTQGRLGRRISEQIGTLSGLTMPELSVQLPVEKQCTSVRIELKSSTQSTLSICDIRLFDEAGNILLDPEARHRASSHEGLASLALPFGDTHPCFKSLVETDEVGYWESSFCTSEKIQRIEVDHGIGAPSGTRLFYSDFHLGNPTYLGTLDVAQTSTVFKTMTDSQENCQTLVVRQEDGVEPLQLCDIRVFDQGGRELFDTTSPGRVTSDSVFHSSSMPWLALKSQFQVPFLKYDSNKCFSTSGHAGSRWLSVEMCLPRPIRSIQVSTDTFAKDSIIGSKAHVINAFGDVFYLGTSFETEEVASVGRFITRFELSHMAVQEDDSKVELSSRPIALNLQTQPALRQNVQSIYFDAKTPFQICEIEVLDTFGENLIAATPLIDVGPKSAFDATFLLNDNDLSTCLQVENGFIWVNVESPTTISEIRVRFGATEVALGVFVRNDVGILSKFESVNSNTGNGFAEYALRSSGEVGTKFHIPYDDVNFGELAAGQLQVGGSKKPFELKYQTVESCAALCGEWFNCKGFYLTSTGRCLLRGGLTAGDEVDTQYLLSGDATSRRLQDLTFKPTTAPTISPTKLPAVPTTSPTRYPTAFPTTSQPTESPTIFPTLSPTTPRPTFAPTEPLPESARVFERNIKNFAVLSDGTTCLPHFDHTRKAVLYDVSLEACATVCDKTPTCVALGWNVDVCQMFTSQFELHECDERANGLVQLVSLARLVEGSQDGVHMRDIGSMKPADGNTGTTNDASSLEDCEQACKSASSCTMSRWSQSQCTLYDTRSWLRDKDKANEPIVSDTGKGSSTSVKTQTARYETLGSKRLPHSKAILLHTVGDQTYLSCMAICDFLKSCDGFNYDEHSLTCYFLAGLFHNVDAQLVHGTHMHFYRKRYFLRASRFGAMKDFARLSQPVMRSECESICDNIGGKAKDAICNAYVHNDAGQCRLSTFEKTNRGILLNDNGYCVAESLPSLVREQCLELEFVFNAGNGDLGRIRTSDGNCATRTEVYPNFGPGLSDSECASAKSGKTINDMWTWDGSTRFDSIWSAEAGAPSTARSQLCQKGVQKAFDEDGDPIDGFSCLGGTWGLLTDEHNSLKYENVYVTPEALAAAQTVTNPDVLYFRWLYSSEGKTARSLMSKAKSLQLTGKDLEKGLNKAVGFAKQAESLVRNINTPVAVFQSRVGRVGSFLSSLGLVLRIGDHIPYVKYVSKPMRKIITKAGGKVVKGVANASKNVNKTNKLLSPLHKLEYKFKEAISGVSNNVAALTVLAGSLVALGFCASQSEIQEKIVIAERKMKQTIAGMDKLVEIGSSVVGASQQVSSAVSAVKQEVIGRLNAIQQTFDPVMSFLNNFRFLLVIFDYRVCFDIPIIGEVCLPTVREIGEAIAAVFNFIRKIPFVGWVIGIIEDILSTVLDAIFGSIEIPLPSLDINMGFLDGVIDALENEFQKATAGVTRLLDVQELMPFDLDLLSFQHQLPSFDCDEAVNQCTINPAGFTFSADGINIPGIDIPDINFEQVGQVFTNLGDDIVSVFESIAAGGSAKCVEWGEPLTCDAILKQFGEFGESIIEEFAASGCPLNIPVCHRWDIPGVAAAQVALQDLGKSIEEGLEPILGSESRRRLSGIGNSTAFEIPIFGPNTIFGTYFQSAFTRILQDLFKLSPGRFPLFFKQNWARLGFNFYRSPGLVTCVVDVSGKVSFKILSGQLNFHVWGSRKSYSLNGINVPWKSVMIELGKEKLKSELLISVSTRVRKTTRNFSKSTITAICKLAPDYLLNECEGDFDKMRMQWKEDNKNSSKPSSGQLLKERGQTLHSVLYWLVLKDGSYFCDLEKVYEYFISETMARPPCGRYASYKDKIRNFARGFRMQLDKRKLFGSASKYVKQHLLQTERQDLMQHTFKLVFSDPVHFLELGHFVGFPHIFGAVTPFEYLHDLIEYRKIKNKLSVTADGYQLDNRDGLEISLPYGFVLHTTPQSCFLPGRCDESLYFCPILLTKYSYDVNKPDNSICTCNDECLNKCINGMCGLDPKSQIDNPARTDSPSANSNVFIAVAFAMGGLLATVVVVRKRRMQKRLEKRGRFDSQAREYVRDGKVGVANPMFVGEEDVDNA